MPDLDLAAARKLAQAMEARSQHAGDCAWQDSVIKTEYLPDHAIEPCDCPMSLAALVLRMADALDRVLVLADEWEAHAERFAYHHDDRELWEADSLRGGAAAIRAAIQGGE